MNDIRKSLLQVLSQISGTFSRHLAKRKYDIKQAYEWVYGNISVYNYSIEYKNKCVDDFTDRIPGVILDAGCGEGIHLKRLLAQNKDVFGVELSRTCCEKYLIGYPHENSDIVTHLNHNTYDSIICFDVLEHIPHEQLNQVLSAIKRGAPVCILGIANHSDVLNGKELHLIQQGSAWWQDTLQRTFQTVRYIDKFDAIRPIDIPRDRFFVFECSA